MKIRIQGNSIRLRLSKPEVEQVAREGCVEEFTGFDNQQFSYSLQRSAFVKHLRAEFNEGKISILIPYEFAVQWPDNNIISLDHIQPVYNGGNLYLLVEKDFKCTDRSNEDQSLLYDNPGKNC